MNANGSEREGVQGEPTRFPRMEMYADQWCRMCGGKLDGFMIDMRCTMCAPRLQINFGKPQHSVHGHWTMTTDATTALRDNGFITAPNT